MENDLAKNLENDWTMKDALRGSASHAAIIIDLQRHVAQITADAASLLGVSPDDVVSKSMGLLPEGLRTVLEEVFSQSQPAVAEINLTRPDGSELNILVKATPLLGSGETPSGAVAVLSDLNAVEKFETHLARIDRLASIGSLSASMAHEIKNALVAVKTFMDLLLLQNKDDELAGIVGREMTRVDSIVSQILKFSGPAKPVLAPLAIHDLLQHSLRLVQPQLAQKNISLQTSFEASPDIVKGDDYQLKQAFLNLLFNAIEATQPEGSIHVSTEVIPGKPPSSDPASTGTMDQLRVTIHDTGLGIPPEHLTRVFEPFFTTKTKGTGLGLPITRRIVHEHRATINVDSQPEQGATFSVTFPMAAHP